ncbi:MAG: zinc finger, C3HC4 type-domain-containing protein [Benjaminiella poitrasii]|nr:MAG: zinc finger, C3HC4 type-domain-containing protein [Benjaminiella poitrasii]
MLMLYTSPVRCCDTCEKLIRMQNMNSNELSQLSAKELKEYIKAYHLPSKTAIEKSDLVRIIFNTRPISNESECYYRQYRTRPSIVSSSDSNNNGFSFSNIFQDLFSPLSNTTDRNSASEQLPQRQRQPPPPPPPNNNNNPPRQQQPRRQFTPSPTPNNSNISSRTSTPLSTNTNNTDNLLSLHDMIKANIDPASLSVRTLKSILKANFVEQSHVIEKSELVKLVQRLVDQYKAEYTSNDASAGAGKNDDNLCRICFDAQQNCVFLDCGHMVTCMECAKKLIEANNQCPICREPILKLVHVFRS